jgi:hypothetical protein
VSAGWVTPASGSGSVGTFASQFSDTRGVADLTAVHVRFSNGLVGATSTCQIRYDLPTGLLSLRDDLGNWLASGTPGSTGTSLNSQCSLNLAMSSVVVVGQTVTLTLRVTFAPAYAGPKGIYLYAASLGGAVTDWQPRGSWIVP